YGQGSKPDPYSVVHGWPVLPAGLVLGQISGVAVDSHNNVFVFHRVEGSWATDHSQPIASDTILFFDGGTGLSCAVFGGGGGGGQRDRRRGERRPSRPCARLGRSQIPRAARAARRSRRQRVGDRPGATTSFQVHA